MTQKVDVQNLIVSINPQKHIIAKEKPKNKHLIEIQGLRGIAILSVLLFHLWPDKFKAGYLGVDIFFVISGFLMCTILNHQKPLNCSVTFDFYFRRLKRIFPTYLFCILLTLLAAFVVLSPTDYKNLTDETKKPLMIIANWPDNKKDDYFHQDQGQYNFFLHLWSLSCELQFYLFVPFLVFILHRCHLIIQLILISTISVISIYIQFNSQKDHEHMELAGRVWQFMFGFLSFYLGKLENKKDEEKEKAIVISVFLRFVSYFLPLLLVSLIVMPLTLNSRLDRLLVTSISMLVIWRGTENKLLDYAPLTFIGNISFSMYLVHYPLIEWYKYENVELFAFGSGTTILGGVFILLISTIFGHLTEELFVNLSKRLCSWKSLLFTIFILYASVISALGWLSMKSVDLSFSKSEKLPKEEIASVFNKAVHFYEHFDETEHLTKIEQLTWTKKFYQYELHPVCDLKKTPTNFKDHKEMGKLAESACVVRRNGTKTIVVFGNSHARAFFPGIVYQFGDVIKEATLLFKTACNMVGVRANDWRAKRCSVERHSILPVLRAWKHPIDIIIFGHAYTSDVDEPIVEPIEKDPIYQEMNAFFGNLSEIAREAVIVPTIQFDSGLETYLSVLRRKLLLGESLRAFRIPIKHLANYRSNTRRRIAKVECPNCLKVDYSNVWCKKTEGFCETVDQERRIPFFHDRHHTNVYGSLFVGHYLRNVYDEWRQSNKNKILESRRKLKTHLIGAISKFAKNNKDRKKKKDKSRKKSNRQIVS